MAPYANPEIKKIKDREYREKNKERMKRYFQKYHADHRETRIAQNRERYYKNHEENLKKNREYYQKNKEYHKKYRDVRREEIRAYDRKHYRERLGNDIQYKIKRALRSRLAKALQGVGIKSDRTLNLLGCDIETLKKHIELQFQEGMSWNNYGHDTWHIDHIVPCASFDLTKPEEQRKCFHYTNLQPIWAKDNLSKGAKVKIRDKILLSYAYTLSECKHEYDMICEKVGDLGSGHHLNKIVLTYQPHFYEVENNLWKNPDIRDFIIENRMKYIHKDEWELNDKEVLRAFKISGKHIGFSHFNPLWIKWFIEKYNVSSIYDPCCGWGHRLLGAHNIRYIGNDLDNRTTEGLKKIITDFSMKDKTIYNNDCTIFSPPDDYEAVFTCPPYFNTEIYQGKIYESLEEFEIFLEKMFRNSMKPSVMVIGIVINQTYKDLLIKVANGLELDIIEQVELGTQINHFQRSGTNRKAEHMIIFRTKIGTQK